MTDIEVKDLINHETGQWIGWWLDEHMPNPPLPDEQRWTLGTSDDGRVGIRFASDKDATYFSLRWV